MVGITGHVLLVASFAVGFLALIGYALYGANRGRLAGDPRVWRLSNLLFGVKTLLLLAASGLLVHLILTHQFNYYYVYNYTSSNLELRYLISAFWGGQEGSFLLWILFAELLGLGLMGWSHEPYRGPVLAFLTLSQLLLISMVLGVDLWGVHVGASPFRTLAEAFPDAPFIQANPGFVPADGKGLNDLLRSPWMVIHPPMLFLGFAMMTAPFCFAMAALWKRRYDDWVAHAMPWALAGNLFLFIAIFLGGYWAYVTLSFGGFWAWDPVENASIIPWILGMAGIHFMLIHRSHEGARRWSILFAILAYAAVVYESFLTRSGILGDASVHSFTDLGLYNQLLLFMVVVLLSGIGLLALRWRDMPSSGGTTPTFSREMAVLAGALTLFLLAVVIAIGTSSPIIGRLFVDNPTPPEIQFYNEWSMPLAIVAAILTVVGQFMFWKRQDAESLAAELVPPVALSAVTTLVLVILADIRQIGYIVYLFAAWLALFGNARVLVRLARRKPQLVGGTLSHIGFGLLLLGVLASSAWQEPMLDAPMREYNRSIAEGKAVDADGFPILDRVEYLELRLNEPKVINGRYRFTYLGHRASDQARPGQHEYDIRIERLSAKQRRGVGLEAASLGVSDAGPPPPLEGAEVFHLLPQVYPSSTGTSLNWSVDVDVKSNLVRDIYLYVAGSSYVERRNREFEARQANPHAPAVRSSIGPEWVLLKAEEKPFVSLVWLGTFVLMGGSSVSIFRRWERLRSRRGKAPDHSDAA